MVAKQPGDPVLPHRDQKQVIRSLLSHQDDRAVAGSSGCINKFERELADSANWANRSFVIRHHIATSPDEQFLWN